MNFAVSFSQDPAKMKVLLMNFPMLLSPFVLQLYSFSSLLKLLLISICLDVPLFLRLFLQC